MLLCLGTALALAGAAQAGLAGLRDVRSLLKQGSSASGASPKNAARSYEQPLQCFQVTNPVLTPDGLADNFVNVPEPEPGIGDHCELLLMDHSFANSYGQPFVGQYKPPPCKFNRVSMNLRAVSEGTQFDRLAVMYLNSTEVWRTSTAEPTKDPGIVWAYWKDMTPYNSLWHEPQNIIFDLGNIVNSVYTGAINVTLTATFFWDLEGRKSYGDTPDVVLPVSAMNGPQDMPSAWVYPQDQAVSSVSIPRHAKRAVFSISATGQADEEFWWSNVPQSVAGIFNATAGTLPGLGSFREVQLRIDGKLAGLSWPFPVIFTGGISPPLHRPMVGVETFDLREQEIDLTPWIGYLTNGRSHEFQLDVVGVDDSADTLYPSGGRPSSDPTFATPPSNWVLSGKIFIWTDDKYVIPEGGAPTISVSPLNYEADTHVDENKQLHYAQTVSRKLEIRNDIFTSDGRSNSVWSQDFSMTNYGVVNSSGLFQSVDAAYAGEDRALSDDWIYYYNGYRYPLYAKYAYKIPDGSYDLSITAKLSQGMDVAVTGPSAFPNGGEPFWNQFPDNPLRGTVTTTTRNASAFFYQYDNGTKSGGFGSSRQLYQLGGKGLNSDPDLNAAPDAVLYVRDVAVVNSTVTADMQHFRGMGRQVNEPESPPPQGPAAILPFAPYPAVHRGGTKLFRHRQPGQALEARKALFRGRN